MTPNPIHADSARALSVLIVTYNSARQIGALLHTLALETDGLDAEVVLVDNASHDGTAELVVRQHPWVRLVRSGVNLGFAAGNNLAAQQACGATLLLLNPDAVPAPGVIRRSLALMRQHPDVGLAGGQLRDPEHRLQPSARMFPGLMQEFFVLSGLAARFPRSRWLGRLDRSWADPEHAAEVDWVPGAFALVRADLFARLGGFDERYFLYYEEVDLCRRIAAQGYRVMYWPELRVQHIGGESARSVPGTAMSRSGSQLTLWRARSALLYYRKHHGWLTTWCVNRLERGWHALRAWRARRAGGAQAHKVDESASQAALLRRAWVDTLGGRVAPPRPW